MPKQTIDRVDVAGKRVLMRVDFNVPLGSDGRVTDDRRIRAALPSIRSVVERGGRLILMSHLGRPKGVGPESGLGLEPVAAVLGRLLPNTSITFVPGNPGDDACASAVAAMGDGEIVLLDNLRFDPGEKKGDAAFAARLAALADVYCNNAFGTAHRNDASMFTVPQAMAGKPRVAGALLRLELDYLADRIEHAERPFVAVLGGAKVSDKLGALRHLVDRVDDILVGGAMAYTFLRARGIEIGASRVEEAMIDEAGQILALAEARGATIHLPTDHVCGRAFDAETEVRTCAGSIDDGWMGFDIGRETVAAYARIVEGARTVVWNGPMGVFEMAPFAAGTKAVAEALVRATEAGAVSIVGGGDSAAALEAMGLADRVSHVSTGGGASLQMLEGRSFDSVGLLDDAVGVEVGG